MASAIQNSSHFQKTSTSTSNYNALDNAFNNLDQQTIKALAQRLASYYRPINR